MLGPHLLTNTCQLRCLLGIYVYIIDIDIDMDIDR